MKIEISNIEMSEDPGAIQIENKIEIKINGKYIFSGIICDRHIILEDPDHTNDYYPCDLVKIQKINYSIEALRNDGKK